MEGKKIFFNIAEKVKNKILKISKGEQGLNSLLFVWGLTPGLLSLFFVRIGMMPIFLIYILSPIVIVYFLWHFICIFKTLKVHPEYVVKKIKKKELYKDKTEEEISEIKKEKRKSNVKKLLLVEAWDTAPNYRIIKIFDLIVILQQIKILTYINQ